MDLFLERYFPKRRDVFCPNASYTFRLQAKNTSWAVSSVFSPIQAYTDVILDFEAEDFDYQFGKFTSDRHPETILHVIYNIPKGSMNEMQLIKWSNRMHHLLCFYTQEPKRLKLMTSLAQFPLL